MPRVNPGLSGAAACKFLRQRFGLPKEIVFDNGPEGTSRAMFGWSERTGVRLRFIEPGKPTDNAYIEAFNSKFRQECLDAHWFLRLRMRAKRRRLGAGSTMRTVPTAQSDTTCR